MNLVIRKSHQKTKLAVACAVVLVVIALLMRPAIALNLEMPAQSFNQDYSDVNVSVQAPAGALPAGTTMQLAEASYDAQMAAVKASGLSAYVIDAVDISFMSEGEEIEPAVPVTVSINTAAASAQNAQVIHVADSSTATVVEGASVQDGVATFSVDEFSVYAIIGENDNNTAQYNFYTPSAGSLTNGSIPTVTDKQIVLGDAYVAGTNSDEGFLSTTQYSLLSTQYIEAGGTLVQPAEPSTSAYITSDDNLLLFTKETVQNDDKAVSVLKTISSDELDQGLYVLDGWYILSTDVDTNGNTVIKTDADGNPILVRQIDFNLGALPSGLEGLMAIYDVVPVYKQINAAIFYTRYVDSSTNELGWQVAEKLVWDYAEAAPSISAVDSSFIYDGKQYKLAGWTNQNYESAVLPEDSSQVKELGASSKVQELYAVYSAAYTITFNTVDSAASIVSPLIVEEGSTLQQARVFDANGDVTDAYKPSLTGYEFEGWYTDANYEYPATEDTTITSDITLYAKWKQSTTSFTVYVYKQSKNDNYWKVDGDDTKKNYDYVGSRVIDGVVSNSEITVNQNPTGTTADCTVDNIDDLASWDNSSTLTVQSKALTTDASGMYYGYELSTFKSQYSRSIDETTALFTDSSIPTTVKISADGSTVVSVYYNRVVKTISLEWYKEIVETQQGGGPNQSQTKTTYSPNNDAKNAYDNFIENINSTGYDYNVDDIIKVGDSVKSGNTTTTTYYTVFTGYYGQDFTIYNYSFPVGYVWKCYEPNVDKSVGNTYYMEIFNDNIPYTYKYDGAVKNAMTVTMYIENKDSQDNSDFNNYIIKRDSYNQTRADGYHYYIDTDKYAGFKIIGYSVSSSDDSPASFKDYYSGSLATKLCYNPQSNHSDHDGGFYWVTLDENIRYINYYFARNSYNIDFNNVFNDNYKTDQTLTRKYEAAINWPTIEANDNESDIAAASEGETDEDSEDWLTSDYILNGYGLNDPEDVLYNKDTCASSHYKFDGWYLDPNYETPLLTKTEDEDGNTVYTYNVPDTMPSNNIALYAKWSKKTYRITFDAANGEISSEQISAITQALEAKRLTKGTDFSFEYNSGKCTGYQVSYEYKSQLDKILNQKPTLEGYTFQGWFFEDPVSELEASWDFNNTKVESNIELTAKWQSSSPYKIKYMVKYNGAQYEVRLTNYNDDGTYVAYADGASVVVSGTTTAYITDDEGNPITDDDDNPVDALADLIGWSLEDETQANTEIYLPGTGVITCNSANDLESDEEYTIVLYAVTTPSTTITFDANDGGWSSTSSDGVTTSSTEKTISVAINSPLDLNAVDNPTRTGYTFLGWSLDPDQTLPDFVKAGSGTNEIAVSAVDTDDDKSDTLYAVWGINLALVKYGASINDNNVLANAVFQLERTSDNLKGTDDDEYYDVSSTGNFKGVYYTDASQSTTRGLWGYTAESNSGSSDDSAPAYRAINGNAYTDTDGVFVFYGLPDGYYELTEVKAPDGYNTLESITFKIYEGKITESSVANLDYTSDVNPDYNAQTLNLVDESGFTLPSTGGVGDYLIYILGGVGILGAASMWMFVKRRQTARRCCTRR